jgi:O-antigen ligase
MVILSLLVMLLALASVWNVNSTHIFEYHGHTRWSGPWDNPNIAGLLMGTGVALALGLGISRRKVEDGKLKAGDMNWKLGVKKYAVVILCFFAAILMARGLLHSYSRGAWLATTCGFTYLAVCELKAQSSGFSGWIRANAFSLTVVAFSIFVLAVWQFGQAREVVARRAFSIGNVNDFSWRTRVAAWEGALQIIAKKPWFGFGWNQPEPMYEHYYRMPKGVEGRAVQLNDYLMLGATLGIPALFCFGMYLWLSLFRNSAFSLQPLELLPATCRAGAIVLLVGFWFDGGLFKLATASTFWILLELGAVQLPQKGTKSANEVP